MRIDITSLCFGFKIEKENDSGTAAWATSIGQAPKDICYIDTKREGLDEIVYGMMYKSHSDFENLKVRDVNGLDKREEPRGDRERMMFSVFEDVFVNNIKVEGIYTLAYEREDSRNHKNRLHICYAKYLTYKGHSNKGTLKEMAKALGCNDDGCWFVTDISIQNQEELHFTAIVVSPNHSMTYPDSKSRRKAWEALMPMGNVEGLSQLPNVKLKHRGQLSTDKYNRYVSAMMTKPFVLLAGISGTGKSQIVRKLARATDDIDFFANEQQRWEKHAPENFEIVQVKPNWHNSLDLLGYKSNIGERPHYVTTPFIRFMVKAMLHPNTPFLLCLDEMNLAPVEEYFAEYLSAIESRSIENGQYKTDTIIKPFKQFDEDYMTEAECVSTMMLEDLMKDLDDPHNLKEKVSEELLNKGLMIPQNLIVFGTVNMDETTFSFSRKVLDRAMSIEMNVVQFGNFVNGQPEEMPPVLTDLNGQLVYRQVKAQQCLEGKAPKDYKALAKTEAQQVVDYLEEVNKVLEGTPFKLGYRACNEALLYARANKEIVANGTEFMKKSLDEFTMMKILSRIEGDTSKLHFEYNKDWHDAKYNKAETLLDALEIVIKDHVELGQSDALTKLESMKKILERDHFVSFWG